MFFERIGEIIPVIKSAPHRNFCERVRRPDQQMARSLHPCIGDVLPDRSTRFTPKFKIERRCVGADRAADLIHRQFLSEMIGNIRNSGVYYRIAIGCVLFRCADGVLLQMDLKENIRQQMFPHPCRQRFVVIQ